MFNNSTVGDIAPSASMQSNKTKLVVSVNFQNKFEVNDSWLTIFLRKQINLELNTTRVIAIYTVLSRVLFINS